LIQPFFGAVSPILLIPGLSLKFLYLVFGRAELSGHFVGRFYGLPVFFLSSTGVGNAGIDDVNCGASIRSLLRLDCGLRLRS